MQFNDCINNGAVTPSCSKSLPAGVHEETCTKKSRIRNINIINVGYLNEGVIITKLVVAAVPLQRCRQIREIYVSGEMSSNRLTDVLQVHLRPLKWHREH